MGKENMYKLFLCKWWGQSSGVTEVAVWAGLCYSTQFHPNKPLCAQYSTAETGQVHQTEREAVSCEEWVMMLP